MIINSGSFGFLSAISVAAISYILGSSSIAQVNTYTAAEADTVILLPVKLHPQEADNWCWAACTQMIMEYMDTNVSQCEQANIRFFRKDCCNQDPSFMLSKNPQHNGLSAYSDCAQPGWPQFEKYGFSYKIRSNEALSWEELKAQLGGQAGSKGRPVAFSWKWNNGGGHIMVAIGVAVMDGEKYVIILDPWPVNLGDQVIITYSAYVELTQSYSHWDDFFDVSNNNFNFN